ncbi:MAG TPA: transglutaminase-like domain-containing protein [Candidatus Binatia bacterium]|jgi:regulator of sirC expression with transglutaminase-like and TPR domain|nr:transglutaminase-like domain-containing protein [Candidatus Binatia bacterium]
MNRYTFSREIRRPEVDLLRAGLLFSREIAYPGLDVAAYEMQLDDLAVHAADALDSTLSRPIALARYLFQEAEFQGNASAYEDPRNSYLNEVLERRLGIPISLSVVFIAVAGRLGIDAYGLSLPGHFIVGAHANGEEILLDPFHQGRRLALDDCQRLVRQTTGYEGALDPAWMCPASPQLILARMLNNLRTIYVQAQQWERATAVVVHLRQLQPGAPEHLRDLGLIHYQQGRLYRAAHYLENFLDQAPDSPEATAIRQNLQMDFSRWARLN